MTPGRLIPRLVPFALYTTLAALLLAAFTLSPARARASAPLSERHVVAIQARAFADERAAPVARAPAIVRDAAPSEVGVIAPAPDVEPIAVAPQPAAVRVAQSPAAVVVTNDVTTVETRMLALMNASRAAAGLAPLAPDAAVASVARAHSAVESQVRYVYHDGPDGLAGTRDAAACGSGWYGENTGKVWNRDVAALHAEFMSEPWAPINHRTNIMDPSFRRVGIGAVFGADALYMTMVFCR